MQRSDVAHRAADRQVLLHGPGAGPQLHRVFRVAAASSCSSTSWRNPGRSKRDWGLDDYVHSLLDAVERGVRCGGQREAQFDRHVCRRHPLGIDAELHGRAGRQAGVNAAAFGVMLLDFASEAPIGALSAKAGARRWRKRKSANKGILPAEQPGERVRVDAAQRPGLELLGQQLPDGQGATALRHPRLERRRHQFAGEAARRSSSTSSRTIRSPSQVR